MRMKIRPISKAELSTMKRICLSEGLSDSQFATDIIEIKGTQIIMMPEMKNGGTFWLKTEPIGEDDYFVVPIAKHNNLTQFKIVSNSSLKEIKDMAIKINDKVSLIDTSGYLYTDRVNMKGTVTKIEPCSHYDMCNCIEVFWDDLQTVYSVCIKHIEKVKE